LTVALLERGAEECYPCNTRFSSGFINCAWQSMRDDPAVLERAIETETLGFADRELAGAFARHARPALQWLLAQGIRTMRGGPEPGHRDLVAPPPLHRRGLEWQGRGADAMVRLLGASFEQRGGRMLRATRTRELVMSSNRCAGVVATSRSGDVRIEASAVVLADGGFQGDLELLRRYVSPRPERLMQRNAGTASGDALRMASAVGAASAGMEWFYGHVLSRDALADASLWPYPTLDVLVTSGIAVDAGGQRFVDEGLGGVHAANAIARLADPLSTFVVFDETVWQGEAKTTSRPPNSLLVDWGGTLHRSETLAGIAEAAGLPAAALEKTVSDFNQAVTSLTTAKLEPPRSASKQIPRRIERPPFYAAPLCAGITYTMGGIAIDGACRVLRPDRSPIAGLFAAGSATGGHEGGPRAGYTGGLGKALTFGWLAGNEVRSSLKL
jgi:fumarate reductase flavoprotein subunit